MSKIAKLEEITGMDTEELLKEGVYDSICWGICSNEGCDYTAQVEPDCRSGHCEECGTKTVRSICDMMGII